jgi:phosphoribosylformylglycinamidine synthase
MKFGIVVFPGSNCDRDVATVTHGLLQQPTRMIWHQDTDIADIDVLVLPGGFSYGDYLRCGAIARFSLIMRSLVAHAGAGKYVLGICNGFQILTEVGLLPGALIRNANLHFICDRVSLEVVHSQTPWTAHYTPNSTITLPIAHGEGCYFADADTLKSLEDHQQILFRYTVNSNGSLAHIAGIVNTKGNVLGMMPHPERAADPLLRDTDGLGLFQGLLV